MGRLLRVTFAILAPIVVVIFYAAATYKPGPPDRVESLVYAYLYYRDSASPRTSTIQQIVEATRPGNFTPQMSKITFGSSVYYRTTVDDRLPGERGLPVTVTPWPGEYLTLPADRSRPPTPTAGPGSSSSGYQGGRALPFPPVELWCVQLRQPDSTSPGVIFVAQHQDLYNADWIVHEPAAATLPELNVTLMRVGCDMALQPSSVP